jgi:hypothetical protein
VRNGAVLLDSPGGNLKAGIEIGKAIRLKEFVTVVPDGALCASACALVWLGGQVRFMAPTAKIGFHSAYRVEGSSQIVDGGANAVAGAYLNTLGLPERAIYFIANAPPAGMSWLSLEDASRYGIEVKRFDVNPHVAARPDPADASPVPKAPLQPTPVPMQPVAPTVEEPSRAEPQTPVHRPAQTPKEPSAKPSAPAMPRKAPSQYLEDGHRLYAQGRYNQAIRAFSEVIREQPGFIQAYCYRGVAYRDSGQLDRAITDFSEAIRRSPGYVDAYVNRGATYKLKGDVNRALADAEFVLSYRRHKDEFTTYAAELRDWARQRKAGL